MTTPGTVYEDGIPVSYNPISVVHTTEGVTGITGATAISRWAGATTSGVPTSGTFALGDWGPGQDGAFWVCTTAGTVGSGCVFTQVGSKLSGAINGALLSPGPAANAYLANTCDILAAGSTMTFASSTNCYVTQFYNPSACTTTYADVNCTANATGTVTHAYAGIYSLAGVQLAISADIHTAWGTGTGKQTFTWTTPLALAAGTDYYIAIEVAFTTATPTLMAATANGAINFNVPANTERYSLYGTSATIPASLVLATLVSGAAVTAVPWAGIY